MSTFLYFIEQQRSHVISADDLPGLGLAHAFEQGGGFARRDTSDGPGGKPGTIIAVGKKLGDVAHGYYPDRQQWRRMPGRSDDVAPVYIGICSDTPPTPAGLARSQQLKGHPVKLADRNTWMVPVARGLSDDGGDGLQQFIALPCTLGMDDQGQWTSGQIEHRWQPLWEAAQAWLDVTMSMLQQANDHDADDETPAAQSDDAHAGAATDLATLADYASLALAANYRVTRHEVAMLGLLNQHNVGSVLNALIDLPTMASWAAKNAAAAGSTIADGPADVTPDTDPVAPILSN